MFGSVAARAGATVETFQFRFVTSAVLNLPAGTVITGSELRSRSPRLPIATVSKRREFVARTDQDGKVAFSHSNQFRGSFDDEACSRRMNDVHTRWIGTGTLSNGFTAPSSRTSRRSLRSTVTRSYGDPLDFPSGETHCDPL
jgi:hypothetical protein